MSCRCCRVSLSDSETASRHCCYCSRNAESRTSRALATAAVLEHSFVIMTLEASCRRDLRLLLAFRTFTCNLYLPAVPVERGSRNLLSLTDVCCRTGTARPTLRLAFRYLKSVNFAFSNISYGCLPSTFPCRCRS